MAYHSKKKKVKKKKVRAGYGSMKKVKAMAHGKKKKIKAMAHGKKKKVKAGYGAMKKKRVTAKANGLTPAQKKLPVALQKAILKKKKKK